jgi:hypothetical protein
MDNEDNKLLFDLYDYYINQISETVIEKLKKSNNKNYLLSGDDSGLTNIWEEICVQVQDEYSEYWEVYKDTIKDFIETEISNQPGVIQTLLYETTQTEFYKEQKDIDVDDSVDEIYNMIMDQASSFQNENIKNYIAGDYENEDEDSEEDYDVDEIEEEEN